MRLWPVWRQIQGRRGLRWARSGRLRLRRCLRTRRCRGRRKTAIQKRRLLGKRTPRRCQRLRFGLCSFYFTLCCVFLFHGYLIFGFVLAFFWNGGCGKGNRQNRSLVVDRRWPCVMDVLGVVWVFVWRLCVIVWAFLCALLRVPPGFFEGVKGCPLCIIVRGRIRCFCFGVSPITIVSRWEFSLISFKKGSLAFSFLDYSDRCSETLLRFFAGLVGLFLARAQEKRRLFGQVKAGKTLPIVLFFNWA